MRPEHHASVTFVGRKGICVSLPDRLLRPVPAMFHASRSVPVAEGGYGQHRRGVKIGVPLAKTPAQPRALLSLSSLPRVSALGWGPEAKTSEKPVG